MQQQNILNNSINQNISTCFNPLNLMNCNPNPLNLTNLMNYNPNPLNLTNLMNYNPNPPINIELEQLEQKNKKLKEEIKNIIEHEDGKQKILKITIPDCLDKNITATTIIVYGNISGDIKAENVICMEGNINSNNIQTNKIFTKNNLIENGINNKQYNYRKKHPNCRYCKFKESKQDLLYTYIKHDVCTIKDKEVDNCARIRASFCSYYKPKEIKEEENNE